MTTSCSVPTTPITVESPSRTASVDSPSPTASASTPAVPPTWETTVSRVRSGVVRLQVAGCHSAWAGTGFLIKDRFDDQFVVTAAHVARDASTISVKGDHGIVRASVIYYDLNADTALLRLQQELQGHRFTVASTEPGVGLEVGVLGYPFGVTDLRLTKGTISGGDISVTYDGQDGFTVEHVVTTDAAINGGNSGGPAINLDGRVVGLVSGNTNWNGELENRVPAQGNNLLVPANIISKKVRAWDQKDGTDRSDCDADESPPIDPDFDLDVSVKSDEKDASDIALALYSHGDSINQGFYSAAWEVFTPKLQNRFRDDVQYWQQGLQTSYWDRLIVTSVSGDDDRARTKVKLRTRQDEKYGNGHSCLDWNMTYSMVRVQGTWLIDDARGSSAGC
jgi:serine protease Do